MIEEIPEKLQDIIKNNLISIKGQKELYLFIRENYEHLDYLKWKNIPTYDQLWKTLYLGYHYLESVNNEGFVQSKAVTALKLVNETIPQIILEQMNYYQKLNNKDPLNKAIDYVLKFQRTDANFKIPKILAVVESIQRFSFEEKKILDYGDYTVFSAAIENGQINERFHFLIDYGVPSSAIKKISKIIPNDIIGNINITDYLVKNFHKIKPLLISYEEKLLLKAIN